MTQLSSRKKSDHLIRFQHKQPSYAAADCGLIFEAEVQERACSVSHCIQMYNVCHICISPLFFGFQTVLLKVHVDQSDCIAQSEPVCFVSSVSLYLCLFEPLSAVCSVVRKYCIQTLVNGSVFASDASVILFHFLSVYNVLRIREPTL